MVESITLTRNEISSHVLYHEHKNTLELGQGIVILVITLHKQYLVHQNPPWRKKMSPQSDLKFDWDDKYYFWEEPSDES